jgi:hypothetical protein
MIAFRGVTFRTRGPPVTLADIKSFEEAIGHSLPDDYRDFLLQVNGGELSDNLGVPVKDERLSEGITRVDDMYNITPGDRWSILSHAEDYNYHLRTPQHIFPIGQNGVEDRLSMSLGKEDYGRIYVWRSSAYELWIEEEDCRQDYSELYELANNFTEFWSSLRPVPPMY